MTTPSNQTDHTAHTADVVLARLRPAPDHLDAEWGEPRREAALSAILAAEPTSAARVGFRPRGRRRALAGAVAACGAAAAVAATIALPSGSGGPDSAAAATLDHLAVVAGSAGTEVGPGQYAYTDTHQVQKFSTEDIAHGTHPVVDQTFRVYTARSGDSYEANGGCLQHFPVDQQASPTNGDYDGVDSSQLAALPTAPDALARFIDQHPSGDNRDGINRFTSVSDLVGSGLATPQLRAAAIEVLAQTDAIAVDDHAQDALGRDAIRVDYVYKPGTVASLYFDPSTSALLEDHLREPGLPDYQAVVRETEVVDSLPDRPSCG